MYHFVQTLRWTLHLRISGGWFLWSLQIMYRWFGAQIEPNLLPTPCWPQIYISFIASVFSSNEWLVKVRFWVQHKTTDWPINVSIFNMSTALEQTTISRFLTPSLSGDFLFIHWKLEIFRQHVQEKSTVTIFLTENQQWWNWAPAWDLTLS